VFHLQHVLLPLLARMGTSVRAELVRPGYVPRSGGILRLAVTPARGPLRPLLATQPGSLQRIWGIALSSHLAQRRVSARMADAARQTLAAAGLQAAIEEVGDTSALQPGATLALFADLEGGTRVGADCAGAPRRAAEAIGAHVARQLDEEFASGASVDRFVADQLLPFAAEGVAPVALVEPRVGRPERAGCLAEGWHQGVAQGRSHRRGGLWVGGGRLDAVQNPGFLRDRVAQRGERVVQRGEGANLGRGAEHQAVMLA